MAGKKGGENSKKAVGQARKADAAAAKAATEDRKNAAAEDEKWGKGAKTNAKKEAEAAKKAEQARKKAELQALQADDEKNTPGRATPKNVKKATAKPSRGIGSALSQLSLDDGEEKKAMATDSITGALELFDVMDGNKNVKVELHPERRYQAAFAAFRERREKEMKEEGIKLKYSQRGEIIREEFAKSPDNPFNQVHAQHNATKGERLAVLEAEMDRKESYLVQ
ncbi:hypothetical protein F4808DRAFT_438000 [Astrocystis sublimbata]|nr:hypothetical protein F4808DRAFT_438000 [Astrocystis sublimbata]